MSFKSVDIFSSHFRFLFIHFVYEERKIKTDEKRLKCERSIISQSESTHWLNVIIFSAGRCEKEKHFIVHNLYSLFI